MLSKRLAERVGFEPTNTFWDVTHFPGERLRPLGHLSVNRILIKPTAGGIDSGHPGPRPTGALRASKIAPGDFVEPTNTFWDVTHFPGERLRPLGHLSVNRILIKPTAGGIDSGHPGPRPTGALRASKIAPGDFVEPTNTFWDVTHFPGERLRPLGHLSTRPQGYRRRPGRSNLAAGRLIGRCGLVARRDVEAGVFRSGRGRRKLHGRN